MQIGIVGLPFSGKSTLFQTMTRTHLDEATLARQQTNNAMVKVPDPRVDKLGEIFQPKKLVYTSVEFVDVVGLKKGDHNSTQFTGAFLGGVKTNDALMHVVRAFDDPLYPHPEGSIDPARDVAILETEFLLSDLAMIENRMDKLRKQVLKIHDDRSKRELVLFELFQQTLESEKPLRTLTLDARDEALIKGYQFLTLKPMLVVLNLADDAMGQRDRLVAEIRDAFAPSGIAVDAFVGKVEMELAQMEDEDAAEFMKDYGITESALTRIIRSAYDMLGLISFLTFGEDECRAWTIRRNTPAQEAAGAIHTDLMNRFIRAEVVHFDDFLTHGSIQACKDSGHWRLEGKEYVVKDGDMLTIRHG
ncbi:MAG: redox-regulated ATPase YchF [Bacteroidota bacterium]|jgi:GTP-binding protein YchF|nr:redox-regulated ATPase YchF [Bacteroidota bacterium]